LLLKKEKSRICYWKYKQTGVNMSDTNENTNVIETTDSNVQGKLVLTLDGDMHSVALSLLELDLNSSTDSILSAASRLATEVGTDNEDFPVSSFAVRKAMNTNTIFVFPKPVAG
jgi:hypothetical protein